MPKEFQKGNFDIIDVKNSLALMKSYKDGICHQCAVTVYIQPIIDFLALLKIVILIIDFHGKCAVKGFKKFAGADQTDFHRFFFGFFKREGNTDSDTAV